VTETRLPAYAKTAEILTADSLAVTPAEMHGLIAGMLSGGLALEEGSWLTMLYDYTNQGMGWPTESKTLAMQSYHQLKTQLTGTDLDLDIYVPDDEHSGVVARAEALVEWINTFLAGVGLIGTKGRKLSKDVTEALSDLKEVAQLGIDEDGDLQEQADLLEQVVEHVRVCSLVVHAELGARLETDDETPKTRH
jgi:yecA family protein